MPAHPTIVRGALVAATLLAACGSLDLENPNAADASRALADPAAVEAIAGGTLRSFFNTHHGLWATGPLTTQAQAHTSSWANWNMNLYASLDPDGTRLSRAWQNSPAAAGRRSVEWFWEGYYSTVSSATDVLRAIRVHGLDFPTEAQARRAEAVAELMLGAALGQIALNYDRGFAITETSDLGRLTYVDRRLLRDTSVAILRHAADVADQHPFILPAAWTNGGGSYDHRAVARLARSLAALTMAYWPRTDAENAGVDWALVAELAAGGVTEDVLFVGDGCIAFCPQLATWSNGLTGMRVHTRVAARLDPVTQQHPYPPGGNPQPSATDRRLGDGSYGPEGSFAATNGTVPRTPNAGSDFAWSSREAFLPVRGQYHQSNIAHIRWDASGAQSPSAIFGGFGPFPLILRAQNDLVHAEALLRSDGNRELAATLINRTRVGRGGLPAAAADDPLPLLFGRLSYEQDVELLSIGAATFYNRRRSPEGMIPGTPREMPVPAKELNVRGEPLYTWGGAGPANSPTPP